MCMGEMGRAREKGALNLLIKMHDRAQADFFLIMKIINQMLRHSSPPFTSYLSDSKEAEETKR